MKVKFQIALEQMTEPQRRDEFKAHYEPMGMLYDGPREYAYIIFEMNAIPIEGQRILFKGVYYIIEWLFIDVENKEIAATAVITEE